jgi:hypothetical protein
MPSVVRTPTVVGVVTSEVFVGSGTVALTLDGGQRVVIDLDAVKALDDGGEPDKGELLLYGRDPDREWYVALRPHPREGCAFDVRERGIVREGTIVLETSGLRLPMAHPFEGGGAGRDAVFDDPAGYFCVSRKGEVTSYHPRGS